ncbi:hypothetical protein HYU91_02450 [Candidatus Collierbacteria bacterium]|nr:hypothetical protein [Candidatus Collierbacteria bacterium]
MTRPLLFSILLLIVGIIVGVFASKYLPVFSQPSTDPTTTGTLIATVMRSPTCGGPASVTDMTTCEAPLANKVLKIMRSADSVVFQTVNTDKDGKFTVSLPAGSYQLQRYPDEFGGNIENPDFIITAGKTTTQQFDIDTGIR